MVQLGLLRHCFVTTYASSDPIDGSISRYNGADVLRPPFSHTFLAHFPHTLSITDHERNLELQMLA